jgi:hypothetical protein
MRACSHRTPVLEEVEPVALTLRLAESGAAGQYLGQRVRKGLPLPFPPNPVQIAVCHYGMLWV